VPTFNAENAEIWRELCEVDYFTQFIKSWLAFNAWMRNAYPDIRQDRDLIEIIKEQSNPVRNKIRSLLTDTGQHGQTFRNMVADLHTQLETTYLIPERSAFEKRITFVEMLEINPTSQRSFSHSRVDYSIVRLATGKIEIKLIKQSDGTIFYEFKQDNHNPPELKANIAFQQLKPTRQVKILEGLASIEPYKKISWLARPEDDSISIGSYKFKNDINGLCAAIIEIVYQMRCLLFHGELVPRKSYNLVYEPAYRIVKVFLDALH